jgi:CRISPR/Cas system-associated exonuclease Cas4 (RecB family)
MKYNEKLKPKFIDHNFEIKTQGTIGDTINKSNEHLNQLFSLYRDKTKNRILSPSAINTWLNCRMKFYYRYVNGLKEPDKISSDIDPAILGNILHEIMRKIYHSYIGQVISREIILSIISNNALLENTVNESINEKFKSGGEGFIRGNELIVRNVLLVYVRRILNADKSISPFTVLALEESFSFILNVISGGQSIELRTGGTVDRVDNVSGVTRIVDYKTGSVAEYIGSPGDLFTPNRKSDTDSWLQTLLYCESYLANNNSVTIRPSVYKIKKMTGGIFSDKLKLKSERKPEILVDNYNSVREEFLYGLKVVIEDIFSIEEPFIMTDDLRGKCSYCPYRILCLR